ncbi:MAG: acyl-CoA thioesterase [Verrucomicrobiae bacterium]|nr:acyl-CoA thioesterase [Verrucomicrobiae bacterium]
MSALPDDPSLAIDVRVYYYDTDAAGVVHNIAYLRYIEEARTRLAERLDWPLEAMAEGPVVPVVRRTEIDYLRPAKLADRLRVEGRLAAIGAASFDIEFEVTRPADGAGIVRCRQRLVGVHLATGRPARTRADWRARWPRLVE